MKGGLGWSIHVYVYIIHVGGIRMVNTRGYRRGTRDLFRRPFKKHGELNENDMVRYFTSATKICV